MAKLAKEATTIRRVLESIFRYFDHENLWSPQHGPSLSVLYDIQVAMEKYGMNVLFMYSGVMFYFSKFLFKHHKSKQTNPAELFYKLKNFVYARSKHTLFVVNFDQAS